jgi:hypothetical protein
MIVPWPWFYCSNSLTFMMFGREILIQILCFWTLWIMFRNIIFVLKYYHHKPLVIILKMLVRSISSSDD